MKGLFDINELIFLYALTSNEGHKLNRQATNLGQAANKGHSSCACCISKKCFICRLSICFISCIKHI